MKHLVVAILVALGAGSFAAQTPSTPAAEQTEKLQAIEPLVPAAEPMTLDTIFDLASLTKVVATTTSVMILIEEGKIRLTDRVSTFIPGFERYGKQDITIRHLMTHVSGLRPDVDLGDMWSGSEKAIELAIEEVPTAAP